MKILFTIWLVFVVLVMSAFIGFKQSHPKLHYIKFSIPKGWPKPQVNIFKSNPLTEEGFQLGRRLFYDTRLSKDSSVSCGSCHQQFAAFCTYDHDFSHGINNAFTNRNAPALFNVAWMNGLHWDGGINHIEVQPLAPITAANEMGEVLDMVLKKLKNDTAYIRLFYMAFGDKTINSQRLLKSLAQFTGSLLSCNSKYDKVKRGEAAFNASEQKGYEVFKSNCNSCHTEPLFTDNSYRNNGLKLNEKLQDYGRMRITQQAADSLKFKVPTLRNISLTAPYMHDGRLYTLSQVIEHYRVGINQAQPTLDNRLKNRITISEQEKLDLKSFLLSLTDEVFIKDKRFEQPADMLIQNKRSHH